MTSFLLGGIVFWLIGLVIGSFVGLVADRWPGGEPIALARSHCSHCGVQLAAHDLVPLASYLCLRGRCRHCGGSIGADALIAELAGGAIGALAWLCASEVVDILALALFGWSLLLLGLLDFRHLWLPNAVTLPLLAVGCMLGLTEILPAHDLQDRLVGAAAGFGLLTVFRLAFRVLRGKDGLGAGDAKLLGAIGAWLGWASLPLVVFFAASLGLAYAARLHWGGRRDLASTPLPLGTFLATAAIALLPVYA